CVMTPFTWVPTTRRCPVPPATSPAARGICLAGTPPTTRRPHPPASRPGFACRRDWARAGEEPGDRAQPRRQRILHPRLGRRADVDLVERPQAQVRPLVVAEDDGAEVDVEHLGLVSLRDARADDVHVLRGGVRGDAADALEQVEDRLLALVGD